MQPLQLFMAFPNPLLWDGVTGRGEHILSTPAELAPQEGKEKNRKSGERPLLVSAYIKSYITSRQILFYKIEIPRRPANKQGAVTEAGRSALSVLVDEPLHFTAQKQ